MKSIIEDERFNVNENENTVVVPVEEDSELKSQKIQVTDSEIVNLRRNHFISEIESNIVKTDLNAKDKSLSDSLVVKSHRTFTKCLHNVEMQHLPSYIYYLIIAVIKERIYLLSLSNTITDKKIMPTIETERQSQVEKSIGYKRNANKVKVVPSNIAGKIWLILLTEDGFLFQTLSSSKEQEKQLAILFIKDLSDIITNQHKNQQDTRVQEHFLTIIDDFVKTYKITELRKKTQISEKSGDNGNTSIALLNADNLRKEETDKVHIGASQSQNDQNGTNACNNIYWVLGLIALVIFLGFGILFCKLLLSANQPVTQLLTTVAKNNITTSVHKTNKIVRLANNISVI